MPQALFLDLDGLLIDSEALWDEADRLFLFKYKVQDRKEIAGLKKFVMGRSPETVMSFYKERFALEKDPADLVREREDMVAHLFETRLIPMPGALDFLKREKAEKRILCLVTGSTERLALLAIDKCSFKKYLDMIVTSCDIKAGKPEPEIYEKALEKTGVKAHRGLALEDSPNGVRAAKAAGIACMGVADKRFVEPGMLVAAGADFVVTGLDQVSNERMNKVMRQAMHEIQKQAR
ncbi:MAG: HAD family phosphatase [Deltaproteobacteria bacterium]|nr:HAD family phosphatase [Deltaproteobacteria bacterium]